MRLATGQTPQPICSASSTMIPSGPRTIAEPTDVSRDLAATVSARLARSAALRRPLRPAAIPLRWCCCPRISYVLPKNLIDLVDDAFDIQTHRMPVA
jgi:hypothetical protein